jgi:DNA processing protein
MDDLESLVALNLSGMVGAALHRRLVERFGSAKAATRASEKELRQVPGVGEITARQIAKTASSGAAAEEIERADKAGVRLVPCGGPDYPASLSVLYDAPLVLSIRGTYERADALAIGIVGSRKCTPYGERQAARFSTELAAVGITVVSGLARGIDTKSHIGALRAKGGRTIAVLGSGLERIYPPENEKLSKTIAEHGCLVSEFGLRAAPEPTNFPRRNRIIAGLSLGVLVVEAAEKSGALITADWALEQSREVFCVPGSVESPMSRGGHRLIKQGAKLVEDVGDIVEEIPALAPVLTRVKRERSVTSIEAAVLGQLTSKTKTSEAIAATTRLPESSIAAALTQLCAKGYAAEKDGGFVKGARSD